MEVSQFTGLETKARGTLSPAVSPSEDRSSSQGVDGKRSPSTFDKVH
jgi:hypothetical protein